jgi:histidine triad (HIT) family protein
MTKTLFQKIIDREIPARIEHEDARCIVIHDIRPQAPVHLLIIPKKPIPRLAEAVAADEAVLGHLLVVAGEMAAKLKLERGFRLVVNSGPDAGESVPHVHVHLLGRRPMDWPPG